MQCPQDGSELGEPRVCFLDLRERPASLRDRARACAGKTLYSHITFIHMFFSFNYINVCSKVTMQDSTENSFYTFPHIMTCLQR